VPPSDERDGAGLPKMIEDDDRGHPRGRAAAPLGGVNAAARETGRAPDACR